MQHQVNHLVNWALRAQGQVLEDLNSLMHLSFRERMNDERVKRYVRELKEQWSTSSNRTERLAVLGWQDYEVREILCALIGKLPRLRTEFLARMAYHGRPPPPLQDQDLEAYESENRRAFRQEGDYRIPTREELEGKKDKKSDDD